MRDPLDSRAAFATTHWTAVLTAAESASPAADEALDHFARAYWLPLYAFVRRKGRSPEDAADLVQGFLSQLIERRHSWNISPEKGRFRSFLLACLNHYLSDQAAFRAALKRGGAATLLPIEDPHGASLQLEDRRDLTPDQVFDRAWAVSVMTQALQRLAAEQKALGKERHFAALQPFLADFAEAGDYLSAAQALGMTPNAVGVAVSRLRARYRELVRELLAETVQSPGQIDSEMQALLAAMRV